MFGFGFKRPVPQAAGRPEDKLISKTDIYGHTPGSREAVLLLKEGKEVPAELLPRLVQMGVDPAQFEVLGTRTSVETGADIPGLTVPAARTIRSSQRVLVCEANLKDIERLTHCLVICGFNLSRIHPVRTENSLIWAFNKYRPDIAIVDASLGLEQAIAIAQNPPEGLEKLLVTLSLSTERARETEIAALCEMHNIDVLLKPINRYALNKLL